MILTEFLRCFPGQPRRSGRGWKAHCPCHEDPDPSVSVRDEGGRILVHDFGGCSTAAIVAELGLRMADLFLDPPIRTGADRYDGRPVPLVPPGSYRPRAIVTFAVPNRWGDGLEPIPGATVVPGFTHVASYRYENADSLLVGVVDRFEQFDAEGRRLDKTFRPRVPGSVGWVHRLDGQLLPLYRLPDLIHRPEGARVALCEGEKDAEQVRAKLPGWFATTAAGGANGWKPVHTTQLLALTAAEPALPLILLPDDDPAGAKWLAALRAALGPHRFLQVLS